MRKWRGTSRKHFLHSRLKSALLHEGDEAHEKPYDGEGQPISAAKPDTLSLRCLELVLNERLTKKQKLILAYVRANEYDTATQVVKIIASELNCSRSAVWNNLRSLQRAGLIIHNGTVQLTSCAKLVKLRGENYG